MRVSLVFTFGLKPIDIFLRSAKEKLKQTKEEGKKRKKEMPSSGSIEKYFTAK